MKEYIEKTAFLEAVEDEQAHRINWTDSDVEIQEQRDWSTFVDMVKEAPAADVVEVVRCRDCVNGELCLNLQGAEYVVCKLDEDHVWLPDGFCSYGEHRPIHVEDLSDGALD